MEPGGAGVVVESPWVDGGLVRAPLHYRAGDWVLDSHGDPGRVLGTRTVYRLRRGIPLLDATQYEMLILFPPTEDDRRAGRCDEWLGETWRYERDLSPLVPDEELLYRWSLAELRR